MADRIERAVAKGILASELALTGATIAGPVGAVVGGIAGLIVGDEQIVFPLDMIAIPAYQAYMLNGTPSMQVYIRAGETLMPTGGNVEDVQEVIQEVQEQPKPQRKKRKSGYKRKYTKAFKQVAPRYKKQDGTWKKGGFKRAVKEAHKIAGGKK